MQEMMEIRWHGRAGQGVVTAANVLAQVVVSKGKYVQAFPEFGAEKRGAPVCAFDRISEEPILIHSRVKNPNIVVVLDPTLLGHIDIADGTPDDAPLIINSTADAQAIKETFGFDNKKVFSVDAYEISKEEIGRPIPNTPMIGALLKVFPLLEIDDFIAAIATFMEKKFNPKIAQGNMQAIKRAYNEVKGTTNYE